MTTVQQARQALGQQLRDLRNDAGLSGRQLAVMAGWPPSKVSKIEYGKQMPTEDDIRAWCSHADTVSRVPELIATLRNVDAAYLDWRRALGGGIRREQKKIHSIESETRLIRGYDPALIPGLLHTPDYAAAIFRQVSEFNETPADTDEAVAARMDRQQQYLYGGDRRVHYLINETALYTTVGDTDVMLGQLDRLLTAMALPRVLLGIVPLASPYLVSPTNFVIYDERVVMAEGITAALTITSPREIAIYGKAFRLLAEQSVTGEPARALIRKALETRVS
ncbi:helix-turn-helix domain-containing protein [Nocardia sp. SYP-A9097]|uniref:helix-turn-helix domain-containing protein n=1 Tax=Nocardia sp. SYP-A9097 TaxID=2663237 RepID=UPI001327EB9E|nr:helix-turn-helix transcriptional regulator [Nocardia sp. SYP-A9097]MRH88796.1 helix-turn-helix domain-containing protein [Nocardia sp. SYP-A9097]